MKHFEYSNVNSKRLAGVIGKSPATSQRCRKYMLLLYYFRYFRAARNRRGGRAGAQECRLAPKCPSGTPGKGRRGPYPASATTIAVIASMPGIVHAPALLGKDARAADGGGPVAEAVHRRLRAADRRAANGGRVASAPPSPAPRHPDCPARSCRPVPPCRAPASHRAPWRPAPTPRTPRPRSGP